MTAELRGIGEIPYDSDTRASRPRPAVGPVAERRQPLGAMGGDTERRRSRVDAVKSRAWESGATGEHGGHRGDGLSLMAGGALMHT